MNEPNNSSQMPFSAPPEKEDPSAKRETEGRRETRKRNASEPIQSSAKVADEKKTPTSIATSAPKGAEAARRASPVNKDAFELNKPSLIPPKVGAEQASASKGKSKKSLRRILPAPKGAKESRRIILIFSINQVMVFTRCYLCLKQWCKLLCALYR